MAFKVGGGNKGAVKRTYTSRGLGGTSGVSQSEGSTRSSVNPMDETGDRDSYEGSGTGYRKSIHDQLEALQATDLLRNALYEVFTALKTHARTLQQLNDPQQRRFHQQEFAAKLEDLEGLTHPHLWEGTAVMRLFAGRSHLLIFPAEMAIEQFTPVQLDLTRVDWNNTESIGRAIDTLDHALDLLEQISTATQTQRNITDAAMASMPHGQPARLAQTGNIKNVEFANKTAQWLRSAMLANGRKAIQVQARKLSNQALHLVG